ncbi:hypothetical protein HanPSC8_Chr15g0674471 [Helianthus annuus]|nr:hypothetical protein HanPSC8_Chr15g0674471 [Helianthus annuus]
MVVAGRLVSSNRGVAGWFRGLWVSTDRRRKGGGCVGDVDKVSRRDINHILCLCFMYDQSREITGLMLCVSCRK